MRTIQEFLGKADSKTHYAPSEHEMQMVNEAFAVEAEVQDKDDLEKLSSTPSNQGEAKAALQSGRP
jgi:hypothetical protein